MISYMPFDIHIDIFSMCTFLIGEIGVRGGTGHRGEGGSGVSSNA